MDPMERDIKEKREYIDTLALKKERISWTETVGISYSVSWWDGAI